MLRRDERNQWKEMEEKQGRSITKYYQKPCYEEVEIRRWAIDLLLAVGMKLEEEAQKILLKAMLRRVRSGDGRLI